VRARGDKEALSNSLGIVVESLTRYYSTSHSHTCFANACGEGNVAGKGDVGGEGGKGDKVKGLEKEIGRLRRENRVLRQEVRGRGLGCQCGSQGLCGERADRGFGPGNGNRGLRSGTPVVPSAFASPIGEERGEERDGGKGKGKGRERVEAAFQESGDEARIALEAEKFIGSWGNPNPNASFGFRAARSFESGSTTVPNTPVLQASAGFDNSFADVGLHSLEENMDVDFDGPASFTGKPVLKRGNGDRDGGEEWGGVDGEEKDVDIDIDEQPAQHQKAMQQFMAAPKPGVLKVGFEVEGSRRGEEYSFTTSNSSSKALSYSRSGSMREYNRFSLPSLPKDASQLSQFFNHHLSKDRVEEEDKQDLTQTDKSSPWISPEEREDAICIHQRATGSKASKNLPGFFRYGYAYIPSLIDTNFYRTILISNLPSSIELRDILARVRGGEIVSAMVLDTISLTGGKTAIVQFVHESAAAEYVAYVHAHPVVFGEERVSAEVTLVQTPTWPLSDLSRWRILVQKQTRCLYISHFPPEMDLEVMVRDLTYGNAFRAAHVLAVDMDNERTVWLEFASVNAAGVAFGILTKKMSCGELVFGFAEDPCARPLEDLLAPAGLRTSMLSRIRELGADGELMIECRKCGDEFESNNQLYAHLREAHSIGGSKGFEFEGVGIGAEVIEMQMKRLAALENRKVEIPSFSGKGLVGASWADEVVEEAELNNAPSVSSLTTLMVPPNSPVRDAAALANGREEGENIKENTNAIMVDNINEMMFQGSDRWWQDSGLRKPPVGLAGSKYARLVPAFEDAGERPRFSRPQSSPKVASHLSLKTQQSLESNSISSPEHHQLEHISDSADTKHEAEEANGDNSKPSSPSSGTSLSLQQIALHRLALLDNLAPLPLSLFLCSKLDSSPPRVRLGDLLASSSSTCFSASEMDRLEREELKEDSRKEVVERDIKGPDRCGYRGCRKVVRKEEMGCQEKEKWEDLEGDDVAAFSPASSQPTSGQEQMNPDEICLDNEDEVELGA
jgi:hypothetical protein